jgi:hypothetical protein
MMVRATGRQDLDGQGMNAALEFAIERCHHFTVLRNPRLPGKMTGRDSDAEMGFARFPPS